MIFEIKSGSAASNDHNQSYGFVEDEHEAMTITDHLNNIGHIHGYLFWYEELEPFDFSKVTDLKKFPE